MARVGTALPHQSYVYALWRLKVVPIATVGLQDFFVEMCMISMHARMHMIWYFCASRQGGRKKTRLPALGTISTGDRLCLVSDEAFIETSARYIRMQTTHSNMVFMLHEHARNTG